MESVTHKNMNQKIRQKKAPATKGSNKRLHQKRETPTRTIQENIERLNQRYTFYLAMEKVIYERLTLLLPAVYAKVLETDVNNSQNDNNADGQASSSPRHSIFNLFARAFSNDMDGFVDINSSELPTTDIENNRENVKTPFQQLMSTFKGYEENDHNFVQKSEESKRQEIENGNGNVEGNLMGHISINDDTKMPFIQKNEQEIPDVEKILNSKFFSDFHKNKKQTNKNIHNMKQKYPTKGGKKFVSSLKTPVKTASFKQFLLSSGARINKEGSLTHASNDTPKRINLLEDTHNNLKYDLTRSICKEAVVDQINPLENLVTHDEQNKLGFTEMSDPSETGNGTVAQGSISDPRIRDALDLPATSHFDESNEINLKKYDDLHHSLEKVTEFKAEACRDANSDVAGVISVGKQTESTSMTQQEANSGIAQLNTSDKQTNIHVEMGNEANRGRQSEINYFDTEKQPNEVICNDEKSRVSAINCFNEGKKANTEMCKGSNSNVAQIDQLGEQTENIIEILRDDRKGDLLVVNDLNLEKESDTIICNAKKISSELINPLGNEGNNSDLVVEDRLGNLQNVKDVQRKSDRCTDLSRNASVEQMHFFENILENVKEELGHNLSSNGNKEQLNALEEAVDQLRRELNNDLSTVFTAEQIETLQAAGNQLPLRNMSLSASSEKYNPLANSASKHDLCNDSSCHTPPGRSFPFEERNPEPLSCQDFSQEKDNEPSSKSLLYQTAESMVFKQQRNGVPIQEVSLPGKSKIGHDFPESSGADRILPEQFYNGLQSIFRDNKKGPKAPTKPKSNRPKTNFLNQPNVSEDKTGKGKAVKTSGKSSAFLKYLSGVMPSNDKSNAFEKSDNYSNLKLDATENEASKIVEIKDKLTDQCNPLGFLYLNQGENYIEPINSSDEYSNQRDSQSEPSTGGSDILDKENNFPRHRINRLLLTTNYKDLPIGKKSRKIMTKGHPMRKYSIFNRTAKPISFLKFLNSAQLRENKLCIESFPKLKSNLSKCESEKCKKIYSEHSLTLENPMAENNTDGKCTLSDIFSGLFDRDPRSAYLDEEMMKKAEETNIDTMAKCMTTQNDPTSQKISSNYATCRNTAKKDVQVTRRAKPQKESFKVAPTLQTKKKSLTKSAFLNMVQNRKEQNDYSDMNQIRSLDIVSTDDNLLSLIHNKVATDSFEGNDAMAVHTGITQVEDCSFFNAPWGNIFGEDGSSNDDDNAKKANDVQNGINDNAKKANDVNESLENVVNTNKTPRMTKQNKVKNDDTFLNTLHGGLGQRLHKADKIRTKMLDVDKIVLPDISMGNTQDADKSHTTTTNVRHSSIAKTKQDHTSDVHSQFDRTRESSQERNAPAKHISRSTRRSRRSAIFERRPGFRSDGLERNSAPESGSIERNSAPESGSIERKLTSKSNSFERKGSQTNDRFERNPFRKSDSVKTEVIQTSDQFKSSPSRNFENSERKSSPMSEQFQRKTERTPDNFERKPAQKSDSFERKQLPKSNSFDRKLARRSDSLERKQPSRPDSSEIKIIQTSSPTHVPKPDRFERKTARDSSAIRVIQTSSPLQRNQTQQVDSFENKPARRSDSFDRKSAQKSESFERKQNRKIGSFDKKQISKSDSFERKPAKKYDSFDRKNVHKSDSFERKARQKSGPIQIDLVSKFDNADIKSTLKSDIFERKPVHKSASFERQPIQTSQQNEGNPAQYSPAIEGKESQAIDPSGTKPPVETDKVEGKVTQESDPLKPNKEYTSDFYKRPEMSEPNVPQNDPKQIPHNKQTVTNPKENPKTKINRPMHRITTSSQDVESSKVGANNKTEPPQRKKPLTFKVSSMPRTEGGKSSNKDLNKVQSRAENKEEHKEENDVEIKEENDVENKAEIEEDHPVERRDVDRPEPGSVIGIKQTIYNYLIEWKKNNDRCNVFNIRPRDPPRVPRQEAEDVSRRSESDTEVFEATILEPCIDEGEHGIPPSIPEEVSDSTVTNPVISPTNLLTGTTVPFQGEVKRAVSVSQNDESVNTVDRGRSKSILPSQDATEGIQSCAICQETTMATFPTPTITSSSGHELQTTTPATVDRLMSSSTTADQMVVVAEVESQQPTITEPCTINDQWMLESQPSNSVFEQSVRNGGSIQTSTPEYTCNEELVIESLPEYPCMDRFITNSPPDLPQPNSLSLYNDNTTAASMDQDIQLLHMSNTGEMQPANTVSSRREQFSELSMIQEESLSNKTISVKSHVSEDQPMSGDLEPVLTPSSQGEQLVVVYDNENEQMISTPSSKRESSSEMSLMEQESRTPPLVRYEQNTVLMLSAEKQKELLAFTKNGETSKAHRKEKENPRVVGSDVDRQPNMSSLSSADKSLSISETDLTISSNTACSIEAKKTKHPLEGAESHLAPNESKSLPTYDPEGRFSMKREEQSSESIDQDSFEIGDVIRKERMVNPQSFVAGLQYDACSDSGSTETQISESFNTIEPIPKGKLLDKRYYKFLEQQCEYTPNEFDMKFASLVNKENTKIHQDKEIAGEQARSEWWKSYYGSKSERTLYNQENKSQPRASELSLGCHNHFNPSQGIRSHSRIKKNPLARYHQSYPWVKAFASKTSHMRSPRRISCTNKSSNRIDSDRAKRSDVYNDKTCNKVEPVEHFVSKPKDKLKLKREKSSRSFNKQIKKALELEEDIFKNLEREMACKDSPCFDLCEVCF